MNVQIKKKVLIVDDEALLAEFLEISFKRLNYEIYSAKTVKDGYNYFQKYKPELVILDLKLPDDSGMNLLKKIKSKSPDTIVILITAFGKIDTAVKALRLGASDFLTKPFSVEQIESAVEKSFKKFELKKQITQQKSCDDFEIKPIIGKDDKIIDLFRMVDKLADNDTTVLITGESGTGKELLARYIHYNSLRKSNPFISVNCSAIPDTLLESELFGHMRGSFTGAVFDKLGFFEAANTGAIFLDEIGDISFSLQVKLLKVIEEKKIIPIGSVKSKKINVRIISATNKNLEEEVSNGRFRDDLFYRLNVIRLNVPPLRERKEDIILLANYFLKKFNKKYKQEKIEFSESALNSLKNYAWPGNIRELENMIRRTVILTDHTEISSKDIFGEVAVQKKSFSKFDFDFSFENNFNLNHFLEDIEKKYIIKALEKTKNVQSEAALLLGINRTTLISKLKKYEIKN